METMPVGETTVEGTMVGWWMLETMVLEMTEGKMEEAMMVLRTRARTREMAETD